MKALPKNLSPVIATLVVACLLPTLANAQITVSTAVGSGADVEMRERLDGDLLPDPPGGEARNNEALNTRTSNNGNRNEIIGLRIDLTGHTLSDMLGVNLNLVNYRNNNSARQVALYGVAQGTVSGSGAFTTETWSDTTVNVFGDFPGLLVSDDDPLTQSLDLASLTPLGAVVPINNTSEGTLVTFDDPALTSFVQAYSGSQLITFILAANPGYTSSGQWRAASKEATQTQNGVVVGAAGDFAPFLSFTVIPEPSSLALMGFLGGLALLFRRRLL